MRMIPVAGPKPSAQRPYFWRTIEASTYLTHEALLDVAEKVSYY